MPSKYVQAPSFCYISPTSMLQSVDGWTSSRTHLVLAHLVDTDPVYAQFYADVAARGDFVIMDNSAYEIKTPYSPNKLTSLASQCGAQAVVLPDYPFMPASATIDAAIQYIPQFKEAGLGTFFVPQSKTGDLEEWISCYAWAANNPDIDIIGMSILGIPNALSNVSPSYARVVMSSILLDRGVFNNKKHHHYLGLNAGPALEIPSLLKMGVLDTIDSSGPVWAAILGHQYTVEADSYQMVSKLKMPVNFNLPYVKDKATQERIAHNIRMTDMLFTSSESKYVWYADE